MFYNILFGSGFLGVFIAIALILETRKRPGNVWLGLFLLALSWMSLNVIYFDHIDVLFGVFDWPLAAHGAFLYLYVRELIGLGNSRRQAVHFIPLALWIVVLIAARQLASPKQLLAWWQSPSFQMIVLGFQLLLLGYVFALANMLRQHRRRVRENFSSIMGRDLKWLSLLLCGVGGMVVLWIPGFHLRIAVLCTAMAAAHFLTLNVLGWYALRHIGIFLPQYDHQVSPVASLVPPPEMVLAPPPVAVLVPPPEAAALSDASPEKYSRSGMNDASEKLIGERLGRRTRTERDFLESDITLADLAERIGTSPQLLSQYLNHMLGLNFFDYINGLRVEEVKQLICDPAHAEEALLDLAFRSGFNSKSTFNAAFKKITGMTPSAWRKLQLPMAELAA
jgi:AraC-like DNA-binding protein